MDNFKKATRYKLRVETSKGMLSTEQIWTLSRAALARILRSLKKKLNADSDDDLAFLDDQAKQVDEMDQLTFDVVKDIYLTKKKEAQELRDEASIKEHNRKIMELLEKKEESELEGLSKEELKALLK